ncbi:hypothetical protein GT755_01235 [Herbidospora sp. NEAU-GS84]|uniref:Uncharacterized protein n=1 Tax=Herbidospora solisilvae TaxID=2696284 RepID=A0A7C9JB86_9ACTN|nr:hypothetical protein [Herbidospora solisilvae]NAS20303.1 hypothetical protein [Herbidospora solisilvae]
MAGDDTGRNWDAFADSLGDAVRAGVVRRGVTCSGTTGTTMVTIPVSRARPAPRRPMTTTPYHLVSGL